MQLRLVAYASGALSTTEMRYAQIEKEALASVWACEKFQDYILGRRIIIETDHKPLIPLLNAKELDNLPPRVRMFRLRMTRFTYEMRHVPGKLLYAADIPFPELLHLQHKKMGCKRKPRFTCIQ